MEKTHKKFYQKWWFWAIIVFFGLGAISYAANPDTYKTDPNKETANEETEVAEVAEDAEDTTPSIFKDIAVSSVRNDVTGKWRVASIVSTERIDKYKVEYYNKFFNSDDEIHFIVNFTLGTTTKIMIMNDMIYITGYEHIDGEEHDAKKLGSGMVLVEGFYDKTTGEEITFDDDEATALLEHPEEVIVER